MVLHGELHQVVRRMDRKTVHGIVALSVVMYGPDIEENHRIRELLEDLLRDAQIKPVFK